MKKLKEFFIFITLIIIPALIFYIFLSLINMFSETVVFIGINNYIRLFLNDSTFLKALFNTFAVQLAISFILAVVFAVILFLMRKKIKATRLIFFIGTVSIGIMVSLILNEFRNVLICIYAGILTAFVFWVIELVVNLFKKILKKQEA